MQMVIDESEERLRAVLRLTTDWYWEQDAEFRFTQVIRHERETPAWASAILNKRRWDLRFQNLTPEQWEEHKALVHAHRPFRDLELCRTIENGEKLWLSVSGEPMYDASGAFKGYRGIGRNITDRRRAEDALRQSEQRFKTFMDNSPAIAWIKDSALRYTYLSTTFERLVGRRPEELLGRDDFNVGWPEEAAKVTRENDLAVLRAGALQEVVESAMHVDGTVHHWLNFKFPFPDETGAAGVAGMSIDITARVNAEERARRYSAEVRALCSSLVDAQEAERRRVADELHDLIGQNLTVLGLDLTAIRSALPAEVLVQHAERIQAMQDVLNSTIDAIRGVMSQLRPPALEEWGLVPALHWYASDYSARTGVKVSVAAAESRRLARTLEVDLFRVVQEALTNVAKHSRAQSAEISIRIEGGRVKASVADDGTGFSDPTGARSARRGGWGLPSMRQRAETHGGKLHVEFPGRGTRVVLDVPARYDD